MTKIKLGVVLIAVFPFITSLSLAMLPMLPPEDEPRKVCVLKPLDPHAEVILQQTLQGFGQDLLKHPTLGPILAPYSVPRLAAIQGRVGKFLRGNYEVDLTKAHASLALTNEDFDAFLGLFQKNLAEFASGDLFKEMMERMGRFREQIVQKFP